MFKKLQKVMFLCINLGSVMMTKRKGFLRRYVFLVGVAVSIFLYGRLLLLNNEALFWDVAVIYTCFVMLALWYLRKR